MNKRMRAIIGFTLVFAALVPIYAQGTHGLNATCTPAQGGDASAGVNFYYSTSAAGPWTKANSSPVPVSGTTAATFLIPAASLTVGTTYHLQCTDVDATGNESTAFTDPTPIVFGPIPPTGCNGAVQ